MIGEVRPDTVIAGKLRLVRVLGEGGMGVVWAARHLTLDADVAVKLIRRERVAADPAMLARFEREAKTTARIGHPHVVRVMDYGVAEDAQPFIVMEYLEGFSLAELLEQGGRLSFATTEVLVRQVASALSAAHALGVVHRDIKPQNVFITRASPQSPSATVDESDFFVKVLDFGIAKIVGETRLLPEHQTLTQTGAIMGSPPYMSPEQLDGGLDVDLRTDLWSLAIIVYEALTGQKPFQGSSLVATGAAILKGKYQPASELRPGLPSGIDDWLAKALSLDPLDRFPSATAMGESFSRLQSSDDQPPRASTSSSLLATPHPRERAAMEHASRGPARPTDTVEAPGPKPKPSRRRAVRWGIALAIAVAGGALGLRISDKHPLSSLLARADAACPPGMVALHATSFRMGSAADGETPNDETPDHVVALGAYCLDAKEVTLDAYANCTGCGAVPTVVELEGLTANARSFWSQFCNSQGDGRRPVNCVDWASARAYCESVEKRLPTEAEWEFAARGPERRTYPWGEEPPNAARANGCGAECSRLLTAKFEEIGKPAWPRMHDGDDLAPILSPVGRFAAGNTPSGFSDLAGNVWEWTDSRYCPYAKDDCDDSRRVLRGGGWDTVDAQYLRSAHRRPSAPSARGWSIGFRCAKSLPR